MTDLSQAHSSSGTAAEARASDIGAVPTSDNVDGRDKSLSEQNLHCSICGTTFRDRFEMCQHDWESHGRIKIYAFGHNLPFFACQLCGKGSGSIFGTAHELCQHMIAHIETPGQVPRVPGSIDIEATTAATVSSATS